jgi:hypothetical protein
LGQIRSNSTDRKNNLSNLFDIKSGARACVPRVVVVVVGGGGGGGGGAVGGVVGGGWGSEPSPPDLPAPSNDILPSPV